MENRKQIFLPTNKKVVRFFAYNFFVFGFVVLFFGLYDNALSERLWAIGIFIFFACFGLFFLTLTKQGIEIDDEFIVIRTQELKWGIVKSRKIRLDSIKFILIGNLYNLRSFSSENDQFLNETAEHQIDRMLVQAGVINPAVLLQSYKFFMYFMGENIMELFSLAAFNKQVIFEIVKSLKDKGINTRFIESSESKLERLLTE